MPPSPSSEPPPQLPKRLRTSLTLLSANDPDTLWVRLSSCHINDDHVHLICTALEKNTNVLSLDLSSNDISYVGLAALSSCLINGGGQDMIELDLRGNKGMYGGGELLEELRRERRVLNVLVGKAVASEEVLVEELCVESTSVSTTGIATGTATVTTATTATTTNTSQNYSNIVQNIFQMTEEEEESDEDDEGGLYARVEERQLWDVVRSWMHRHCHSHVLHSSHTRCSGG